MATTLPTEIDVPLTPSALDLEVVYDQHADFAWRSLHRLGVPDRDLPDLLQDVFVVVHRRRAQYDGRRPIRGWIWGICLGLARNYRRRRRTQKEQLLGVIPERAAHGTRPDEVFDTRARRQRGQCLLAGLDPEKRAVFVMFEVEGMSGAAISKLLDVPLGTVHSRLHAARRSLRRALQEETS